MRIPKTTTLQIRKPLPKPNNRDVLIEGHLVEDKGELDELCVMYY
jgi:hypothetical protein